ncbi:hypothetical protein LTS18_002826 [Coniosporium uncinatum]|uniref:Uncharacterized protein n=1 Tax=Coniosporium uncinatum TaxID=93489 RepID=A0ACC3D7I6_9PEZI|nr:hypothetical protein LTS18_002826 [Coniosporium uncinatum]
MALTNKPSTAVLDLAIIGAGVYGLAVASTHLSSHPDADITILDSAPTVGGVWAKYRLYPGLKSNNVVGRYEFPDFPMWTHRYGVTAGQHIPGEVIYQYLEDYSAEQGLHQYLRCNTRVTSISERAHGIWELTLANVTLDGQADVADNSVQESVILTEKLVIATGVTSEPFIPMYPGSEAFGRPIVHSKDFAQRRSLVESSSSVTVLGGAKSAWDIAHAFAVAGVHVNMIIRESGHGPAWMSPALVTPLKRYLEELVLTRFLTWFSPCVWGEADGYGFIRRLLHHSVIGRWIVDKFWWVLRNDVETLIGFDKDPRIAPLKPWCDPFCMGNGLSILNYDHEFFDLVRTGKITVHIADIERLSRKRIHLSNGNTLEADALFCATGWNPTVSLPFQPPSLAASLGLPHYDAEDEQYFAAADSEIMAQFPRLKRQPEQKAKPMPGSVEVNSETINKKPHAPNTPYELYRFMIPVSHTGKRNIAFAGSLQNLASTSSAYIQSLWITAFFDSNLTLDPTDRESEELRRETTLWARFGRWRYPAGFGAHYPDFVFDTLPYFDVLLQDLGLKNKRKGGLRELVEAYGPKDYRGLLDELKVSGRGTDGKKEL